MVCRPLTSHGDGSLSVLPRPRGQWTLLWGSGPCLALGSLHSEAKVRLPTPRRWSWPERGTHSVGSPSATEKGSVSPGGKVSTEPWALRDAQEELNLGARADVPWGRDPEAGPGLLCQWEGKQQGALGVLQGRV